MKTRYKILAIMIMVYPAWIVLTAPMYQQESPCDEGFEDTIVGHCVPRLSLPTLTIVSVYATHYPDQLQPHSIILPSDAKEKTYDEFMDLCGPYYGEQCAEMYRKNLIPDLLPPLKQIQDGTALFNVKCYDGKIPAYKHDNMHVACVTEETHSKLINRGWALLRFAMPDDNPSQVLCNRYDGKWHPKYFGCRDIADNQCSLMGGVSVDNLRICYDRICPGKLYSLCVTNMNLDIQYPDETKEQYDNRCRQSETIRGPVPGPIECDSDLIECVSECGNDDIWHMFDKNGIKIDYENAKIIVEQNEN